MVFVGRAAELAALAEAFADPGVTAVLVAGDAGLGKSRLVAEFAARHAAGARTVSGDCLELDGLPYAPHVTVARRLVAELGPERASRLVPGGGRRGLARWLPVFGRPEPVSDPSLGRTALFEDVLALVAAAAADRPLVVVLEDLHWADPSSRDLLTFLVRNLTGANLLIVGTYRPVPDGHPLRRALTALTRSPSVRTLEPAPLDAADLRELVASRLGGAPPGRLAAEIVRRSEGNPLFAEALADAGPSSTPTPLRDLLLTGFRALPDASRDVVRTLSAAEGPAGFDLLAAVTGLPETDLEAALRVAIEQRVLVRPSAGCHAFAHDLVRQAVYEDLLPSERTRLHLRFGRVLQADPSLTRRDRALPLLAAHWHAAGERDEALAACWRAAQAAADQHAYPEQLRMLERFLSLLPPDADRSLALSLAVTACLYAGEAERGVELATEGLALIESPRRRALLLDLRSALAHRLGDDGLADLREGVALLPDGPERARLMSTLANRLFLMSEYPEARSLAHHVLTLNPTAHERAGPGGDAPVHPDGVERVRADDQRVRGGDERVRGGDERVRMGGDGRVRVGGDGRVRVGGDGRVRVGGDGRVRAWAELTLAALAGLAGDLDETMARTGEAERLARAMHDGTTLCIAIMCEADALHAMGRDEEAWERARTGIEAAREHGLARDQGAGMTGMSAEALVALGRWSEARAVLAACLAQEPPPLFRALALTTLGMIDLAEGKADAAASAAEEARRNLAATYRGRMFQLRLLELECAVASDPDALLADVLSAPDLLAHSRQVWPLLATAARRTTTHRPLIRDLAAGLPVIGPLQAAFRTTVQAELGEGEWSDAVEAWRALNHPYRLAYALMRAGAIGEATALTTSLGAAPFATETPLSLTPREAEVLRLVALGRSNRQIGEHLFISGRTAGVHVSNILAKMRVSSRTEAAAVAHRLGLMNDR
ncbi:helix-turn-helix transcriptional regulator [Actinomadura rupiterrae]|uniref:helix-turn-helix transcriptional regulator n=1 Tax=Actinomadura rupiterrae TaxID=559627 RepID=UPI0020A35E80|nr:helix-turn-helix transcriptional regulator [Actinomadura rupiterrae]MCP2337243.1 DNA-binding CsgD family transcriptional regulator/tetratricopeptide (TPR) repeat protein [Actinomadura rupiterrae]